MSSTTYIDVPQIGFGIDLVRAAALYDSRQRLDLTGLGGGALAPYLAKLGTTGGAPLVIIVENDKRAEVLAGDLIYHLSALEGSDASGCVLQLPAYDLSPYEEMTSDRGSRIARTSVIFRLLRGTDWKFLVASAETFLRKLPPRSYFERALTQLIPGGEIDRDELVGLLEGSGYHHSPLVEEPGTYGVRGSLLDVFVPYMDAPVRVDLFGDRIEGIRQFDPTSQRSGPPVEQVWIHPASFWIDPQDDGERRRIAASLRLRSDSVNQPTAKTEQIIDEVLGGRMIVGRDGYLPALYPALETLFDYFARPVSFCLEHPVSIRTKWRKLEESLNEAYESRIGAGLVAYPPEDHLLASPRAETLIEEHKMLLVHPVEIAGSTGHFWEIAREPVNLGAFETDKLAARLTADSDVQDSAALVDRFAAYLDRLKDGGYRISLVAHTQGQTARLQSMLQSRGVEVQEAPKPELVTGAPHVSVCAGELTSGAILPADGIAWISEEEVFGRRARRRQAKPKGKMTFDDLRQLHQGDLVVHAEHGVGCYEGLVHKTVRGATVDFLLITYRDGDKLYLPIYRLSQVQKYQGAEARRSLDKLGGQTFARALVKAKKVAIDMAGRLLDLYARRSAATRAPLPELDDDYRAFEARFPFDETDDQLRAIDDVLGDLERDTPMDRLVCGDVGFGKTEVALRAAYRMVMSGGQVVILVPTTVLAAQHHQTFRQRFKDLPVRVEMLSRFRTASQNKETVQGIKDGTVDIVVGTHRLLSKDVHFKRLGLLVIDEEHRFGVTHKERIRALRASVDTLVLTATPIPRTLQMSMAGLRDLSIIASAPAERRPIRTQLCLDDPEVLKGAIERELAREGQVFFVHNRVRGIHKVAERLQRLVPAARIGIGHGQMKEEQLERVMLDFVAGRFDILVCTTIVESGLDIPRANTIVIDRGDTFGLAQLYQLRGRVGRSDKQAYAYIVVPPLAMLKDDAVKRVETLARYTDLGSGFSVATMDLEIRGAGNVLGAEQSGNISIVGYEMFCELLAEATAELQGLPFERDIEPELTFESQGLLPETYIPDVGLRLHYYKRFASAVDESAVEAVAAEMIDRFGPPTDETEDLIKTMIAKTYCRGFKIPGLESSSRGMVLHLTEQTTIDPQKVVDIVKEKEGRVLLSRDMKLRVRFDEHDPGGADGAIRFLRALGSYDKSP